MAGNKNINLNSIGMQFGVLAGLGCILFTLVLYLIRIDLVLSFWIFAGYAIIVIFKIITGLSIRKARNNYVNFKDGLRSIFLVSVISLFMWNVFNAVMFSYINPQLIELSKEKALERTAKIMEIAGASEDEIDDALDKVKDQDFSPSLSTSAMNYAMSCIVGFIYSLAIAGLFYLVTKDNAPVDPA